MDKKLKAKLTRFERFGLYQPQFEKDACGVGFVANINGKKSHSIVEKAIEATINLTHRGAVSADAKTGDGAGVLTQVPHKFFKKEVEKLGGKISDQAGIGVGMIFFPHNQKEEQEQCRKIIEETIAKNKLQFLGWRKVPIDSSVLGDKALSTLPQIEQVLMGNAQKEKPIDFERTLYLTRKEIEKRVSELKIADFYIHNII